MRACGKGMKSMLRSKAAAALAAAAVLLAGCSQQAGPQRDGMILEEALEAPDQANYHTAQVERGNFVKEVAGSGNVVYPVQAELRWTEGSVRFDELYVTSGSMVSKGDVLASFTSEDNQLALEEKRLALKQAQKAFALGKQQRQDDIQQAKAALSGMGSYEARIQTLNIQKLQSQYDQYVYQTEYNLTAQREEIERLQSQISETTLVAPFDGVVDSVVSFNKGDKVDPSQVLVTLYASDRLLISADDAQGEYRYNMPVTVQVGNKDDVETYTGKVIAASNILPAALKQGQALIELDQKLDASLAKRKVAVTGKNVDLHDVLMVNRSAVKKDEGRRYVYVLDGDTVKKRYVVEGGNNLSTTWILDGLTEGQTLILD